MNSYTRGFPVRWLFAGAIIGAGALCALLFFIPMFGLSAAENSPSPELTVVAYATPTETFEPTEVLLVPTDDAPGLLLPGPGGEGGDFLLGQLVEVFGTEGEGLRLRVSPSLEGEIVTLGLDSEVFEISDGPVTEDGYEWWQLSNPYGAEQTGWAVSTFLRSIDG